MTSSLDNWLYWNIHQQNILQPTELGVALPNEGNKQNLLLLKYYHQLWVSGVSILEFFLYNERAEQEC